MKYYLKQNVYEVALDRIRYLYDEFPQVIVTTSGGKDSTVVYNLALMVAEEKGRLPQKVMFIDQEAEWRVVIEHIRKLMNDPRVKPRWLQVPIILFNATSTIEPWLHCWEPGKEWIRDKEPNSIHENIYGTNRFGEMFTKFLEVDTGGQKACYLSGVRAEESPARTMGLTTYQTYKHITWGKVENKKLQEFAFYPIYDWSYTDVWKAIHDNNWPYCKVYDYMYQHGVPIRNMRVSNVHHETAVRTLFYLQEVEHDTWDRVTKRISGINTAGILSKDFFIPEELPWMFNNWKEYRDHLLDNLIIDQRHHDKMKRSFDSEERRYEECIHDELFKMHVKVILTNDYHGTAQSTFVAGHGVYLKGGKFGKAREEVEVGFKVSI